MVHATDKDGLLKGAVVRLKIDASNCYPSVMPTVKLKTKVDHPLVDRLTGRVDLSVNFAQWRADNYMVDILM
jgi:ubiquitin-protein ligase